MIYDFSANELILACNKLSVDFSEGDFGKGKIAAAILGLGALGAGIGFGGPKAVNAMKYNNLVKNQPTIVKNYKNESATLDNLTKLQSKIKSDPSSVKGLKSDELAEAHETGGIKALDNAVKSQNDKVNGLSKKIIRENPKDEPTNWSSLAKIN